VFTVVKDARLVIDLQSSLGYSTFCYLVFVKVIIIKVLTDQWLHLLTSIESAAATVATAAPS